MISNNNNKSNLILINLISDIISREFIKANMYGVCLPSNIILWTALNKLKIDSKFVCGKLQYIKNNIVVDIPIHFWIEIDNVVIDPTRKITEYYREEVKNGEYKFLPNQEELTSLGDIHMIKAYKECLNGNAKIYWSEAPTSLLYLKQKIECRIRKIIKINKNDFGK